MQFLIAASLSSSFTGSEFELSRRDIAEQKVLHKVGDLQELARQSTVVKMAAYKRQRETTFLLQENGIELPPAD